MKAHEILNQAQTEMQDRAKTYDKPQGERSMGACVAAFEAITRVKLTVEQGWLFMCLLKAVRSQQGDYRADNYVDLAAYAGLMGEAASDPDQRDRRINKLRAMKEKDMALPDHGHPIHNFDIRSADVGVTQEEDEAWDEKRADIIGQNGNGGEHYKDQTELTLYIYNGHRIVGQAHNVGRCSNCGEVWICGERIETTCPGKPCDHTAGFHSLSSTSEKICIDCKEVMPGKDDAKLTTHKRVSSGKVGPDT